MLHYEYYTRFYSSPRNFSMSSNDTFVSSQVLSGRYRLLEVAGRGGMGEVWRAVDITVDRIVAIKLVLPAQSEKERVQRIARLDRERQVLIKLSQHPGIVTLFDIIVEPLGYVMEWIDGFDLRAWLDENPGPHPPELVVSLLTPILNAVGYAHQQDVVHRDLKASNILLQILEDQVNVRVMDFGLARIVQQDSELTADKLIVGTPEYMAPEQISGERPSAATDIYALGIILYEALTGEKPYEFPEDAIIPTLVKKIQEDIPSPRLKYPALPQELEDVILKATRREQRDRYATCSELLDALKNALTPEQQARIAPSLFLDDLGHIPPRMFVTDEDAAEQSTSITHVLHAPASGQLAGPAFTRSAHVESTTDVAVELGHPLAGLTQQDAERTRVRCRPLWLQSGPKNLHILVPIVIVLIAATVFAFQKRQQKQARYVTPSAEWHVWGQAAGSVKMHEIVEAYAAILHDWSAHQQDAILNNYRSPIGCYYNNAKLPNDQLPIDKKVRDRQGLANPPFEVSQIFVSEVASNSVVFFETGRQGSAQQPYTRLVRLVRSTRSHDNQLWRIDVEASSADHACYSRYDRHMQNWRKELELRYASEAVSEP